MPWVCSSDRRVSSSRVRLWENPVSRWLKPHLVDLLSLFLALASHQFLLFPFNLLLLLFCHLTFLLFIFQQSIGKERRNGLRYQATWKPWDPQTFWPWSLSPHPSNILGACEARSLSLLPIFLYSHHSPWAGMLRALPVCPSIRRSTWTPSSSTVSNQWVTLATSFLLLLFLVILCKMCKSCPVYLGLQVKSFDWYTVLQVCWSLWLSVSPLP